MANYAVLIGCPSKDATQDDWGQFWNYKGSDNKGWGPLWRSKYCVAGFWLACFSLKDKVRINRADADDYPPMFTAYFVESEIAVKRLLERKDLILSSVPKALFESYGILYDNWIETIRQEFPKGILLDCDDLFNMTGHEEGSLGLEQHLDHLIKSEKNKTPLDLTHLGLTGLLTLGDISPYEAVHNSPNDMALAWRYTTTGYPEDGIPKWLLELTPEEISFAKHAFSNVQEDKLMTPIIAPEQQKPWWRFW
jgi:hypothetical protein